MKQKSMQQTHGRLCRLLGAALMPLVFMHTAQAQTLTAFSNAAEGKPPAPWRVVGIPKGKVALADVSIVTLDGNPVLRMQTNNSYSTLVQDIKNFTPSNSTQLSWKWRLDEPLQAANLRVKSGDDAALKVCVSFDMPTDDLPFGERATLSLARTFTGQRLPAATLCYVWDTQLAAGTALPNAYSQRVHFVVLDGKATPLKTWRSHTRNVAADFMQYFGRESKTVPPIEAIVLGADSDNTHGSSMAYVGDVVLKP